jgi:hypothetical protein
MQLCATEPFTKGCIVSKASPEQGRWLSARRQLPLRLLALLGYSNL